MRSLRPALVLACVCLAAVPLATTAAPSPLAGAKVPQGISRHVLENGLTVIIKEHPVSDLVVTEAVVRAGPRVEDAGNSGITAFVRNMLVRGTRQKSAAEIAQTIESVGGRLGGDTLADAATVYAITPGRHVETGMELLADMLTEARFDPQDVEVQRRVSLSRVSQVADQPLQRSIQLFLEALFPYHPYARGALGTQESVASLTREHLVTFYQQYFTAPNIVLVVAGNVTEADTLERVRRLFGRLRATPPPRSLRWLHVVGRALAPRPSAPQDVREVRPIAAAWISLGFLAVPVAHRDYAALRVANAILGEGASSRLFVEIREKRGLAYAVGSGLIGRAGPGYVRLSAGTDPPNLSAVIAAMLREVERLRAEAPPEEDVEKAKRAIIGRDALAHEELESQALFLGWYEAVGAGYEYDWRFPQEIARVTPADVLRVARYYLTNHVLAVVAPPTAR